MCRSFATSFATLIAIEKLSFLKKNYRSLTRPVTECTGLAGSSRQAFSKSWCAAQIRECADATVVTKSKKGTQLNSRRLSFFTGLPSQLDLQKRPFQRIRPTLRVPPTPSVSRGVVGDSLRAHCHSPLFRQIRGCFFPVQYRYNRRAAVACFCSTKSAISSPKCRLVPQQ
jgi:hypothetical protein